ncbi:transcription elongation factor TFIIS [Metarhizium acridum]|nr:transcription elongation factor TFIIS [Metarhizium acridum]
MDQRELESRVKALTKSVAANEPPENAIKLLESLKKDAKPTEEMLRISNVAFNRLQRPVFSSQSFEQTPTRKLARSAAELVIKWKKLVEQEKASRAQRPKMGSPAAAPASSPVPQAGSAAGAKRAFTGDPEKRSFTADGVELKRTSSGVRDRCIGLIYNGLAYRSTESSDDVIARAVCRGTCRSSSSSRKTKSEDQRKKEIELEKENMKRAQVPMAEKSISDSLECSRCKMKKVSYTQAQTRSADEPMTTFCECMNCGHRWKFS